MTKYETKIGYPCICFVIGISYLVIHSSFEISFFEFRLKASFSTRHARIPRVNRHRLPQRFRRGFENRL